MKFKNLDSWKNSPFIGRLLLLVAVLENDEKKPIVQRLNDLLEKKNYPGEILNVYRQTKIVREKNILNLTKMIENKPGMGGIYHYEFNYKVLFKSLWGIDLKSNSELLANYFRTYAEQIYSNCDAEFLKKITPAKLAKSFFNDLPMLREHFLADKDYSQKTKKLIYYLASSNDLSANLRKLNVYKKDLVGYEDFGLTEMLQELIIYQTKTEQLFFKSILKQAKKEHTPIQEGDIFENIPHPSKEAFLAWKLFPMKNLTDFPEKDIWKKVVIRAEKKELI